MKYEAEDILAPPQQSTSWLSQGCFTVPSSGGSSSLLSPSNESHVNTHQQGLAREDVAASAKDCLVLSPFEVKIVWRVNCGCLKEFILKPEIPTSLKCNGTGS